MNLLHAFRPFKSAKRDWNWSGKFSVGQTKGLMWRQLRRWSSNTTPDIARRLGVACTEDNSRMVIACHCITHIELVKDDLHSRYCISRCKETFLHLVCFFSTFTIEQFKYCDSFRPFLLLHLGLWALFRHFFTVICNFAITFLTFAILLLVSGRVLVVRGVLWSRMRGSQNHLHEGNTWQHMFVILTGTRRVNYFVKTLVLNLVFSHGDKLREQT